MVTLFENKDFRLQLTGHDYDFVGTIEVKSKKPLTFFFFEETDEDGCVFEDETKLAEVYTNLKPYDEKDEGWDEAEEIAQNLCAYGYFTCSREDGWKGFLSDPQQRGWFLALVKNYCPKQLQNIPWA